MKSVTDVNPARIPGTEGDTGPLADRRVLVVGLGRFGGGVGVVRWLCGQGADVRVTDRATADTLETSLNEISDLPVRCHLGGHSVGDLSDVELVVINPAVDKRRSAFFRAVADREIPWTTEINLFCERCRGQVVAVTGAYGKSTTCAMIAEALRADRRGKEREVGEVHLGGNIGGSLLPSLERIDPADLVVLELSSAQLDDLPRVEWSPRIAVITNLYPHHLDRYAGFAAYVKSKLNVLGNGEPPDTIVVGDMHPDAEDLLRQRVRGFADRVVRVPADGDDIALDVPGAHNQRNAACALAACESLSCDMASVYAALQRFTGLEHRLEKVATLGEVAYYNDSKSTSPLATIRAIEALGCPVVAIVGGQSKDVPLGEFGDTLSRLCSTVVCTGESGPAFAGAIRAASDGDRSPNVVEAAKLSEAVAYARSAATPGMAVLFSPGAPSFDAYRNFADRGRRFVDEVAALE